MSLWDATVKRVRRVSFAVSKTRGEPYLLGSGRDKIVFLGEYVDKAGMRQFLAVSDSIIANDYALTYEYLIRPVPNVDMSTCVMDRGDRGKWAASETAELGVCTLNAFLGEYDELTPDDLIDQKHRRDAAVRINAQMIMSAFEMTHVGTCAFDANSTQNVIVPSDNYKCKRIDYSDGKRGMDFHEMLMHNLLDVVSDVNADISAEEINSVPRVLAPYTGPFESTHLFFNFVCVYYKIDVNALDVSIGRRIFWRKRQDPFFDEWAPIFAAIMAYLEANVFVTQTWFKHHVDMFFMRDIVDRII